MLAVSMDSAKTLEAFKKSLHATFAFVSDPDGKLVRAFGVKMPVISLAKRYTFVIGEGRKILEVSSGADAIDPSAAVASCPLHGPHHAESSAK